MTTPNTPANGGQILTWQERMDKHYSSAGRVDVHPIEYFKDAEIADLRASLAAPAIPTVDRNAVLEEAVRACKDEQVTIDPTQNPVQPDDESYNLAISHCISAISGLKSADPASMPQPAAQGAVPWQARRYCKGDGEWSAWKSMSASDYEARKSDPSFQFRATPAEQSTDKTAEGKPLTRCAANRDGDCAHPGCPQLRDNEPNATGRHCPIDTSSEDEQ